MDLKIRLPEALDLRLRTHAENTGATLNSIICLAVDAFVPGGSGAPEAQGLSHLKQVLNDNSKSAKKGQKDATLTPKQQFGPKPKMSAKPTKDERRKLAEWHRANAAGQQDLLNKA